MIESIDKPNKMKPNEQGKTKIKGNKMKIEEEGKWKWNKPSINKIKQEEMKRHKQII